MRYRKKPVPVVVDAVQWFPPDHPQHPSQYPVGCEVGMADIGTITAIRPDSANVYYSMKTVSGWAKIEPGDWIIKGPPTGETSRDIYPCKADVFAATYEPAD